MGWSGGSILLSSVAQSALDNFGNEANRISFYLKIIETFEQEDADTLDECFGIDTALDYALRQKGYISGVGEG